MEKQAKINWKILFACLVIVYIVAYAGSIFTSNSVNSEWFNSIKPKITPPNYVFPVVWNILFFLIALSLYFVWTSKERIKGKLIVLFALNLAFNLNWSLFYFGFKNPLFAFIDLILLWISILLILVFSWEKIRIIRYLFLPYLIWVSFAGVLNFLSILKVY